MGTTTTHDDYLICREYKEQISKKSSEHQGFITFQHENSNHYFAWVDGDDIVLRSEAYPDAEKMERGIKAIQKNWDNAALYSVEEEHGAYFLVLWGGGAGEKHTGGRDGHNEIGRSCPKDSKEELNALLQSKGKDFANKVVPISAAASAAAAPKAEVKTEIKTEAPKVDVAKTAATTAAAASTVAAAASASASSASSAASNATRNVTESATSYAANATGEAAGGGMGWLKWLLPLLLLGGLAWWMLGSNGCNKEEEGAVSTEEVSTSTSEDQIASDSNGRGETGATIEGDTAKSGAATSATTSSDTSNTGSATATPDAQPSGESTSVKLADGTNIQAYKGGIEDKLVTFLDNKSAAFNAEDKKGNWYNFDNLNFDFGTANISKSSQVQIDNLAAVLKAYPGLKIKIGGYTDKKGNDANNKTLSQKRADAVLAALTAKGANAAQLTGAEGYGEELATVAESASDEARRVDRRTAVRVMAR